MRTGRYLLVVWMVAIAAIAGPPGAKRVEIDKTDQMLRAYEGRKLVFQCRISTGKWDRSTPNGTYAAGAKERMHCSSLYRRAPMPFSVHVTGNVFIHGFTYVPPWPDSHGCIRLPLDGDNPAKRFYEWVESGTTIVIKGRWRGRPADDKAEARHLSPRHPTLRPRRFRTVGTLGHDGQHEGGDGQSLDGGSSAVGRNLVVRRSL